MSNFIAFTKMQGAGNDFVVIDAINQSVSLDAQQICQLANRNFGVGFDQLLLIESSELENVDFRYRIFNADGTEVEQCGNGARCFARFVHQKKLTNKNPIKVATKSGIIDLFLEEQGLVRVNMGAPKWAIKDIPFVGPEKELIHTLSINQQDVQFILVNMGNPHAVVCVEDVLGAPVAELGSVIESHSSFPQRTNAGFMQVISRNHICLRVYERGVGETLSCGTGACAAVAAGVRAGWLDSEVKVQLTGGDLYIRWAGGADPVWMTGPAEAVFEGYFPVKTA